MEVNPLNEGIVRSFQEFKVKLDTAKQEQADFCEVIRGLHQECNAYAKIILQLTVENEELRQQVLALESENQLLKG